MSTLYDIFEDKTNTDEYNDGKWFSISADSRIKLRGAGSPKSVQVRKALDEPFAKRVQLGIEMTDEENKEIFLQHMTKGIIVDWEGPAFVDDKGKKIKFTPENAYDLLSDEKLGKFLMFLMGIVQDAESFINVKAEILVPAALRQPQSVS